MSVGLETQFAWALVASAANPPITPLPLDPGRGLNGRPSPIGSRQGQWPGVPCSRLLRISCLSRKARRAWRRSEPQKGKAFHAIVRTRLSGAPGLERAAGRGDDRQFKGVIEGLGGKIVSDPEYWGVKTLSFRIRKNRKAHFTLLKLDAPPAALAEMERQKRINEDILRFLTVRVDEHEEGPSAMMRKGDRDASATSAAAAASTAATASIAATAVIAVRGATRRRPRDDADDAARRRSKHHADSQHPEAAAARSSAAARPARSPAPTRRRSTTRT